GRASRVACRHVGVRSIGTVVGTEQRAGGAFIVERRSADIAGKELRFRFAALEQLLYVLRRKREAISRGMTGYAGAAVAPEALEELIVFVDRARRRQIGRQPEAVHERPDTVSLQRTGTNLDRLVGSFARGRTRGPQHQAEP